MLRRAQEQGRIHFCLLVSGLLARAHNEGADEGRTMRSVRELLLYGEQIGAIRSVLDLGPDLIRLIKKYQKQQAVHSDLSSRGPSNTYIERLLKHTAEAFVDVGKTQETGSRSLIGGKGPEKRLVSEGENLLTAREVEVLTLISDGLSNKEIASELILGEGTVKWHVKNIFSKLYVSSRTQAASVARSKGVVL